MKNKIKFKSLNETFRRDIKGNKKKEFLYIVERAKLMLAEKLLDIREKSGMTQGELARKMGVSQQLVSRIESGSDNLTLETIAKFLIALNSHMVIEIEMKKNKEPVELIKVA